MPALMAPSPMTQTTFCFLPPRSRATAMPRPAEIEVEEWPAPKVSYSLSSRLQNPDRPPPWRKERQVLVVQCAQLLWSAHSVKQRRCMFGAHQIPGKQVNSL